MKIMQALETRSIQAEEVQQLAGFLGLGGNDAGYDNDNSSDPFTLQGSTEYAVS